MSTPVTDQLDDRRKQREARARAASADGAGAKVQTSEAARDLLTGLITGPDDEHHEREERAPEMGATTASVDTPAREPDRSSRGENVQDLVRRVQQRTTAISEDASTVAPRAGVSTVDLPPGAAVAKRRPRPSRKADSAEPAGPPAARKHPAGRWAAAAAGAAAGIAMLMVFGLNMVGGHNVPHGVDLSTSHAALTDVQNRALGDAFSATVAAVVPELHALTRAVPPAPRASHPRRKPTRLHVSRHGYDVIQQHRTAVSEPSPATETHTQFTPAVPAQETHSYTPAPAPSTSTSHTSAGSETPATNNSQSAGPTGSDPLGGIGSCVSGCT